MTVSERQQEILYATIRLLAERGLAGVTHRAVDSAAGLPQGSTSYYYPKKIVLIAAAAKHLATLLDEECDGVRRQFADLIADGKRDEAIDFVAQDLLKFVDEGRVLLLARFEIALAGTRHSELKAIADRLSIAARQPIEFFLKLLQQDLSQDQAEVCMGLLDGLALLHVTGQGPKPTVDQIKRIFLSV